MTGKTISPTPSAYTYPLLIKNLLTPPLTHSPDQKIFYRNIKQYTYADMGARIKQLAAGLTALGVQPGQTVAVMDWDSHRYLECFFAVPMMGAVLHTVNIRLSPEQLLYTINHAEDDIILVNAEFLPLLEAIRSQISPDIKIILLNDQSERPATGLDIAGEYEELLASHVAEYDFPDLDENTVATMFYTTGTTGLPKGVYFTHRQLVLHTYGVLAGANGFRAQATLTSGDVYMPITPMFHVHAWGMPYLMTLLGAKQVYPGRYDPATLLSLLKEHGVSFSHCVPTILHMLLSNPAIENIDLSNWKVIIGGSALPKGMCLSALEKGINIFTGYGMSETCPILTLATLQPHMLDWDNNAQAKYRCRTGVPIPEVQLEIIDAHGKPLPHDGQTTGEVVVRAPWLTQGYVKDPQRSEDLWEGGWLHTGDIGFIDELGYLQITDRLKDVIKTGGEWISSLELESIISQHPGVSEAAVIGVPDEKWGERPLALIVPKDHFRNSITEEELHQFFMKAVEDGTIPKYGVPSRIMLVDSIAKTSVGKLNKKELRKEFRG